MYLLMPEILRHLLFKFLLLVGLFCIAVRDLLFPHQLSFGCIRQAKCARIRGAFVGQFDDRMARYYYIDGRRGEPKKISLPRNLVVWE